MKRVWAHVMAVGAGLGVAGALVSACTHDDSTIFVYNVLARPTAAAGQMCPDYTSNPTQAVQSAGVLDIGITEGVTFASNPANTFLGGYGAEFLVGNQMVQQGDPTVPRTETSFVNIQGAIVRVTSTDGTQVETFTRLAAGTIPPASGGTPSYAPIGVEVLDLDQIPGALTTLQTLGGARYITFTKFFGHTLGGQYVESNEYEFPVDVCIGCLVNFSPSDISPLCGVLNCLGNSSTGSTSSIPVPCPPGEDLPTDCSACLGSTVCDPNPDCADAGRD